MSHALDVEKCVQCGYKFGDSDLNCRTGEWWFVCRRCGYSESMDLKPGKTGKAKGDWKHKVRKCGGAAWVTPVGTSISQLYCLGSIQEAEKIAQKVRNGILKCKLKAKRSYVTKWNPTSKQVEVIAGTQCWPEQCPA